MPKYTAKQSIGHFMPGDEIKGLEAKQLQALLASGAIEAYQAPKPPVADDSAKRLADLEKANAELTAANKTLADDKAKVDQEVADLEKANAELTAANKTLADDKAKVDQEVADLEKANAELTAANKTLADDKAKVDQEVADLKAKVAELEKAKPATKPKAGDKSADETK